MSDAFRLEWGRITAALIHQTGGWDLAEECAQDAFTETDHSEQAADDSA